MSVNKAILMGFVGKDPEVRHLESGNVVATFSLATDESWTNKAGERVKSTEWHNIVIWGKLAEFAEMWVKKGCQVYIEGKITGREYETKDKNKRHITEIVAEKLNMITWAKDDAEKSTEPKKRPQNASTKIADDVLPASDDLEDVQDDDQEGDDLPF